ncbi:MULTISPECIES: DUF1127 domain-containing protein [Halocynthiibacter]|uniref:DUF1127 domain-containing protein n=1 Tax=Halocynthiibacter halioticoli TaxID=2986804 RepID=A0AAE3LUL3_9RHOB|nr:MULTISPECIES: DUF1127 domain-containing protein [Halocynthiibacter]MCV6824655.1 DUF1127 domain-containing protein [Halocynthiibacter halioticoli]MCW4057656.1 DUF1127 domain-containing protein [Halocynthiibacter sp. SDUM655004]MDE0589306.1 DUF1127 domain-containing protein [Halocynthiibacter sp. C4]
MAYVATQKYDAKPSIFSALIQGVQNGFTSFAEARKLAADAQELEALSDRQLADIGIRRDEIARRVAGL